MNEKIILTRRVKKKDTFLPLIISVILVIFYNFIKGFNVAVSFFLILFSLLIIFIERYNAVNLTMYDKSMKIEFYLLKKTIFVKYEDIIEIKSLWDSGLGANLRFRLKANNKIYTFRVRFQDDEFFNLLEEKTKKNIGSS
jgi:hypothetical protein